MKVQIEDLQLGDEIIVPSGGSNLRMFKVVGKPGEHRGWICNVRCEADIEVITVDAYKWDYNSNARIQYKSKRNKWNSLSDNYKKRVTVNLAGRDIWLIKRNGEKI